MRDKVESLVSERDSIVAHDKNVMNGAFNEADYPSAQELRAKFDIIIRLWPVPTDFRSEGIPAEMVADWQSEMSARLSSQAKDAKAELLERLADKLAHLAERISVLDKEQKGTRFHDSTVSNIVETCADVRAANFDDDETINNLVSKVESVANKLDVETIRENKTVRAETAEAVRAQLAEVSNAMAGFMS